jgi:hypothetical protein
MTYPDETGDCDRVGNTPPALVERISFLDALRWLGAPSIGIPSGALIVNPTRSHRVEPRVKKRRPKPIPLMRMRVGASFRSPVRHRAERMGRELVLREGVQA